MQVGAPRLSSSSNVDATEAGQAEGEKRGPADGRATRRLPGPREAMTQLREVADRAAQRPDPDGGPRPGPSRPAG
jgi:hypothetical protein